MRHISSLITKFIIIAIILEVTLILFTDMNFVSILWISLIISLISYMIGDNVILPTLNNVMATLGDVIIALFTIILFNYLWGTTRLPLTGVVISVIALGVGEWFFHKLLDGDSFDEEDMEEMDYID